MSRALIFVLLCSALVFAAVLLNACGGGHAQTRFVAAVPDLPLNAPNVDFLVDGKIQAANLAFPSVNGGYLSVTAGNRTIEVRQSGTTTDLVNASNVDFINHDQYTLFFTGLTKANPPNQTVNQVPDDNSPPANGNIKLRFFHASPSGPACPGPPPPRSASCVDIYVVTTGTPIDNLPANVGNLAYQQASSYLNIAAASYDIIVTPVGDKTQPYPIKQTFTFSTGQVRTFVVVDAVHPPFQISPNMLELADLN